MFVCPSLNAHIYFSLSLLLVSSFSIFVSLLIVYVPYFLTPPVSFFPRFVSIKLYPSAHVHVLVTFCPYPPLSFCPFPSLLSHSANVGHTSCPLSCILLLMSIYLSHFAPSHPPPVTLFICAPVSFYLCSSRSMSIKQYNSTKKPLSFCSFSSTRPILPLSLFPTYSAPVHLSVSFSPGPLTSSPVFTVHYIRLSHTAHG